VKVTVALVVLPLPAGVALYAQVGGTGGGGDGGGGEGGGGEGGGEGGGGEGGGAEGGWQVPSQSTMYPTYTKLPSCAFSLTASVAVVTNVYVPSGLEGSGTILAHSKKSPTFTAPSDGLHLPCTSTPLAVVLITYSLAPS
tara:strand:- start:376 stop:795 length:420 start_codon:yes stop_codon:yes gene_type:complete